MRKRAFGLVVSLTILSWACGGQVTSPLSPSSLAPSVTPSTSGATLLGNVRLAATAPAVGSASDPLKVQVVGTDLVTTVSAAGQFTLTNVPPGQIQLRFTGGGVDALVTISQVGAGETITITVVVLGTSAVVESEVRHGASGSAEEQIEGRIEALPPAVPAGSLRVAGRTVATDASTVIRQGEATRTFADLAVGQRVHVKGRSDASTSTFLARLIEIQNTQTDLPVQVNGIVSNLSGSEIAFQFTVDGRLVTGDANTEFFGDGGRGSGFADLKNGVRVEVKGVPRQTGGAASIYAVRIKVNAPGGDDTDDEDDDRGGGGAAVELQGMVSGLGGTCPTLSFHVNSTAVTTTGSTQFKGAGCSAVKNGSSVEVKGTRQADGSVLANKIEVEDGHDDKDDDRGGGGAAVELEGTVSGLGGGCPALSFQVKGTPVATNGSTKFEGGGCSVVQNGRKVEVKGTRQPTGVVLASTVELKR